MLKSKYIIYGLFCPVTDNLHYVGKSSSALFRPSRHLLKSHSEKIREWVDDLGKLNARPVIKILEYCDNKDLLIEKEKFWIYKSVKEGCSLLNDSFITSAALIIGTEKYLNEKIGGTLKNISEFVKSQRKLRDSTQAELAEKSQIGLKTLRKIEQNRNYTIDSIIRLVSYLGAELTIKKINYGM